VASALDAAHAAGLVHRDVKPGNILVDVAAGRGEHAYLSDFGLSKRSMAASGLTATGTFLGTPDYCAPEQIRGLAVDGRGDQYSLACMAFALLTGNLPFRRQESMATLFAHLNDPVPPLSKYRGDLPPGTDAVLARGLAKEPRDRYERCGDFAAALRDTLAGAGPAGLGSGSGPAGRPGAGRTRLESAPRGSRPPGVPETAVWPGTASLGSPPPTETIGSAPRPAAAMPSPGGQPSIWSAPGAVPPASSSPTWAAPPPPVGGRAVTRPAPPPPPAAGQGGKLPLVSRSAVIATLAAVAALVLLYLLHSGVLP
jgi:serine/threonine-protein kinase